MYFGSTSTELKERARNHRNNFRDTRKENFTELAKEIHNIKRRNEAYNIKWEIMKKSNLDSREISIANYVAPKNFISYTTNTITC